MTLERGIIFVVAVLIVGGIGYEMGQWNVRRKLLASGGTRPNTTYGNLTTTSQINLNAANAGNAPPGSIVTSTDASGNPVRLKITGYDANGVPLTSPLV